MKKLFAIGMVAIIACTACNSKTTKKVLVMGKGTLTANANTVNYKEGSGYTETIVELKDEKESTLTIEAGGQKKDITIPADAGFYILNLRTDTVVGSKQNLGSDLNSNQMITQEQLRVKIDSLTQLTTGTIPAGAKDVYIIAPNANTKISTNINARVFGPFTKIPASLDADPDGKELELYKFRTNNEMRELIKTMEEATH
jgi:hypothetical protein